MKQGVKAGGHAGDVEVAPDAEDQLPLYDPTVHEDLAEEDRSDPPVDISSTYKGLAEEDQQKEGGNATKEHHFDDSVSINNAQKLGAEQPLSTVKQFSCRSSFELNHLYPQESVSPPSVSTCPLSPINPTVLSYASSKLPRAKQTKGLISSKKTSDEIAEPKKSYGKAPNEMKHSKFATPTLPPMSSSTLSTKAGKASSKTSKRKNRNDHEDGNDDSDDEVPRSALKSLNTSVPSKAPRKTCDTIPTKKVDYKDDKRRKRCAFDAMRGVCCFLVFPPLKRSVINVKSSSVRSLCTESTFQAEDLPITKPLNQGKNISSKITPETKSTRLPARRQQRSANDENGRKKDILQAVMPSREERAKKITDQKLQSFGDDVDENSDKEKNFLKTSHDSSLEVLEKGSKNKTKSVEPVTANTTRASCCTFPFHVDVSALKSFYKEVALIPPFDSYSNQSSNTDVTDHRKEQWIVKLGDTVTVEVENSSKDTHAVYFPFVVPWSLGEVVSIYKVHKTKESCARLREKLLNQGANALPHTTDDEISIEIRWFYRYHEIPGATKKKPESNCAGLEEVFETDQIDICSADSLLSPVRLYDITSPLIQLTEICGMPYLHYYCSRLWSIHRRTFVPSGPLGNRVSRGRMYSTNKAALRKLTASATSTVFSNQGSKQTWQEAFRSAIQQLSLAEAARDAQENKKALPCREKEHAQLKNFLKQAICGLVQSNDHTGGKEEDTTNLKSSLFIAGPPGTGKVSTCHTECNVPDFQL